MVKNGKMSEVAGIFAVLGDGMGLDGTRGEVSGVLN